MTTNQPYAVLCSLFGDAQAAKFLLTLHRQSVALKRLYFWQEQMLSRLCSETGRDIRTLEQALDAFSLCHVHDAALMADEVPIRYGTRKPPSPDEVQQSDKLWPFANVVAYGPCWVEKATRKSVIFCSGCRASLIAHKGGQSAD